MRNLQSKIVLAIEDEDETIIGILSEFELRGYEVQISNSVSDAKNKLNVTSFGFLLIDLRLPIDDRKAASDVAGLNLLLELRRGDHGELNKNTPYAFVSAQRFTLDRLEAKLSSSNDLSLVKKDSIRPFSKGQSMMLFVDAVITVLKKEVLKD
jgi:CheY-like chemotaxis protein